MRARIVDWSKHQGQTNLLETVKEWNIKVLMARCTIGWSYVDSFYAHNFEQAQNIKANHDPEFLFLAYHVLHPWNNAPKREVDHFVKNMKVDGASPDGAVDDLELPNTVNGWSTVSRQSVANQIRIQLPYMELQSALKVLVYTGSWWWSSNGHFGSQTPLGIEKDYPLIEAEYTTARWRRGRVDFNEAPEEPKQPATLGKGWTEAASWQWTSGLKPIGVSSQSQDGQVLLMTYEEFRQLLLLDAPELTDKEKLAILWEVHPELHPPTEA